LLVVMFISNFFIKSSMHTSFNIFVSALFFTLHPIYGFVWLFLTILAFGKKEVNSATSSFLKG
jgi:hypothetical protein